MFLSLLQLSLILSLSFIEAVNVVFFVVAGAFAVARVIYSTYTIVVADVLIEVNAFAIGVACIDAVVVSFDDDSVIVADAVAAVVD